MTVSASASNNNTRMLDVVKQQAPDGSLYPIIESMSKLTPFFTDAAWIPCNNGTFHRINRRTALPAPTRRRINKGVPGTRSETNQVDEVTTLLSDKAVTDATLIRMNGPEYRAREVAGHMMGLQQQVESDLLLGSIASDPDGIDGILTRLSVGSGGLLAAQTAGQPGSNQIVLVDAAASGGDQMSVLLVGWAPHGVHAVYPSALPGGILHKDYGEVANGGTDGTNTFPAFIDWFEWNVGLAIEDFRYCAAARNIDSGKISGSGPGFAGTNILTAMITLYHRCLTADQSARWAWYMPRFAAEMLHQQARSGVTQSTLRIDDVGGQRIVSYLGIPVRVADVMTTFESVLAA